MADTDPALLYQGQIRPRRGTEADWLALTTPLALGEMGRATDTNIIKFGDGVNLWVDLPAWSSGGSVNTVNNVSPVSGNVTITANDITGISNVGKSGSYNDLTDKPTIPGPYTLPPATTSTLGGVRPDGTSITVDANGVISASGGGGGSSGMIASGFLQSPYNLTPPPAFYQKILIATYLPKAFVLPTTATGCFASGTFTDGTLQVVIARIPTGSTTPEPVGSIDLSVDPATITIPADVSFAIGDQLFVYVIATGVSSISNILVTLNLASA